MSWLDNWYTKYGLPKPVTRGTLLGLVKLPRNIVVSWVFERRRVNGQDELIGRLRGKRSQRLLCVIAYNLPWAVELMAQTCARHMPNWRLLVLDNSSKQDCRRLNAEICEKANVEYISLPRNPEWSPNRSHGLALNWAYQNVIRPVQPESFGFLDHDCFPIASPRVSSCIDCQPFYGIKCKHPRVKSPSWYLWAGYLFFNSALVGGRRLDFNHDQIRLLDTAGRNWAKLYRYIEADELFFAKLERIRIFSVDGGKVYEVDCIDDTFLHVGGASYGQNGEQAEKYVSAVKATVESSLAR